MRHRHLAAEVCRFRDVCARRSIERRGDGQAAPSFADRHRLWVCNRPQTSIKPSIGDADHGVPAVHAVACWSSLHSVSCTKPAPERRRRVQKALKIASERVVGQIEGPAVRGCGAETRLDFASGEGNGERRHHADNERNDGVDALLGVLRRRWAMAGHCRSRSGSAWRHCDRF